jgi:hypothetical protein
MPLAAERDEAAGDHRGVVNRCVGASFEIPE